MIREEEGEVVGVLWVNPDLHARVGKVDLGK